MTIKHEVFAGILLVGFLTIAALIGYTGHLRGQRDAATAAQTKAELEAEGFKEAIAAKPREVIKLVPTLVTKTVTKLIHDNKIEPIVAATIEAKTDITVPCPPAGAAAAPLENHIHLVFTANLLITRIKFGVATEWKGDVGGTAALNDGDPMPLHFPEADKNITIAFSDDIARALRDHEREGGWLKRHTALACPGAGLAVNPFDGRVTGAVTCSYAFVWF